MKKTTSKTIDNDVKEGVVVVKFWASWCGPCKIVGPLYEEVAKESVGIKFLTFELDDNDSVNITEKYGILSVPTVKIFKNGEVVETISGIFSKQTLLREVKKYETKEDSL